MLVLGGVDPQYNKEPMVYTPIVDESYYVVTMTDLLVGNTSIGVASYVYNQNLTIVDSGTTLLFIATGAYNALVAYFVKNVCPTLPSDLRALCTPDQNGTSLFTSCYTLPSSQINLFPTISIVLDEAGPLRLDPQYYFLRIPDGYCFAIQPIQSVGAILGDVFMQAFNVEFDRENRRVGFAYVQNCTGEPLEMLVIDGDGQRGSVGWALAKPLIVQVQYDNGMPAIGVLVEFNVSHGSASLESSRIVTDSKGYAKVKVTLKTPGTTIVVASVSGSDGSVKFTLTGSATWVIVLVVSIVCICIIIGIVTIICVCKRKQGKTEQGEEFEAFIKKDYKKHERD